MRANDLRVTESGEHIRVLLPMDSESYVVDCQHFRMPYAVSQTQLTKTQPLQTEDYNIFVLDEDVSAVQRKERDRRLGLIQPLMDDTCIYDKRHRNALLREILAHNSVNRRTVLLYLWRYWVYQSKNALLPQERTAKEARALTADERIFRWALNKFFYTPQRQSLQTAYKMMLQAKYCDARGRLLPQRPTFWQFRYFYRQHRDPINETISRQGIKAYQRNYRPITGSVSDYATTIGTFMTDATVADIYIVSRLSRKPIGRPAIYTMVDAYSRLITGVYVGLEGGQYALRLLLQNTVADKVTYCLKYGIEIDAGDWPSHHLPARILTDRGTEFLSGPIENLCESYQVEIDTLPAYRPDLKGVVEKLFDLVQSAYKPLLKGRGVVEPDAQERGSPDYRQQSTLDLQQFTSIVLRCVLFLNAKAVQPGFLRTPEMLAEDVPPVAACIWQFCADKPDCPARSVDSRQLVFALLPRTEGKITRRGLEVFHLRFSNALFKKRFVTAGLQGRELVQVAYDPDCMDCVWLYENGTYTAFDLVHKSYRGKSLAEVIDAQRQEKASRQDWTAQELQAQLDLMADISSIASCSEPLHIEKGQIGEQIQQNRMAAREQEHLSMFDLLGAQQEVDFHDC